METSSSLIFTSTDHLDQPGIKGFSLYHLWLIPSVSSRQNSKRAGSRDTEETVWGWGRGQSCCPGLRCGERTVQGWGGRDSPGWVLGAMDAASQEAWGPSACPPPGRASMAVGRPHHASCNGRAEGQDTGDAGVGHS